MFQGFTQSYTGTDATGEIVFMLLVAFILGYLLRLAYEKIMFEDYYDEYDEYEFTNKQVVEEDPVSVTNTVNIIEAKPNPVVQLQNPMVQTMPFTQDDLKIVEGVGPKIESLLQEGGIDTWKKLADSDASDIKTLLRAAGERYRIHDPSTWPEQAQLASEGKWDELKEFQDALSGGKDLTKIYK